MPPKRAAPSTAASQAKKAKTGADPKAPPRSKRWSAVSGSANADAEYRQIASKNPDEFFSFMCTCPPRFAGGNDGDDDSEDEENENEDDDDENENEGAGRSGGCGRPNCKCHKPASEHPDHPWIITKAGYRKLLTMQILVTLRDPDNFSMYTYNDHAAYGAMEVVENMILDFVEGAHSWKEQWIVCEALAQFILREIGPFVMIDDGERVAVMVRLLGTMFLTMLARLERENLLAEGSEVKDLGVVMALWVKIASNMRRDDILDDDREDEAGSKAQGLTFNASEFDNYILAYADKFGIPLKGPKDIEELLSQCDGGISLPAGTDKKNDPWGWAAALKKYESDYGTGRAGKPKIGGDQLDITTWTSAQRKEASFDNKDPLAKKDIEAIKKGMVIQLA